MKRFILFLLLFPLSVYAGRGCCSHHGGVCGCSSGGRSVCCDGTYSPSCTCDPPKVKGCTYSKANNYNPDANTDDGSCKYDVRDSAVAVSSLSASSNSSITSNSNGTSNDTGTVLFYLAIFVGFFGSLVKKK